MGEWKSWWQGDRMGVVAVTQTRDNNGRNGNNDHANGDGEK